MAICFAIGMVTFRQYGASWDEYSNRQYADYALDAYRFIFHPADLKPYGTELDYYGPAFFVLTAIIAKFEMTIIPGLTIVDAWHFVYFLSFLSGSVVFYFLSRRWMSDLASFGITLLFVTQPLLWGHAFINPKDIPFMTFFMTSVYLGLKVMDESLHSSKRVALAIGAGIFLGLTTSFRVIGPLAGGIVVMYGLLKSPRKTAAVIPYYIFAALGVTYLTWPFLWKAPIANFLDSMKVMSKFPYLGTILFMGKLFPKDRIPYRYFPTFLILQLTEPVLILMLFGGIRTIWLFAKGKREPFLLFLGWFAAPAILITLSRSVLYDNARQLMFLWPPLFMIAGLGIDVLLAVIKRPLFKAALLLVAAFPGIYACFHLHPYQYIYYNNFIGGVSGAYRQFDTDYWGTSFKYGMEFINKTAQDGAQVVVIGPVITARQYARPDLIVVGPAKLDRSAREDYYGIYLTRSNEDKNRCREGETLFVIEKDGAVLSYVKKIAPGQRCW
jgi:hypothetical protein